MTDLSANPAGRTSGERLLTADDVAGLLGMSRDWVYAEVRAGRVPHVRLGRYVRFREASITEWVRELEAPVTHTTPARRR